MTTAGISLQDQKMEKEIEKHVGGCMAGFFNLSQILSGKRLYSKRLPPSLPSPVVDSVSEPVSSIGSPRGFEKKTESRSPETSPELPKSPVAVSAFEFKEGVKSPWKFTRETPRLSLDSRAVVDAKGSLRINTAACNTTAAGDEERRSPSVIVRLMGLDRLPSSSAGNYSPVPEKTAELRRSASESRSRNEYRFFDTPPSFPSPITSKIETVGEIKPDQSTTNNKIHIKKKNNVVKKNQRVIPERKSYYDTSDFFPSESPPVKQPPPAVTIYGEIERRLRRMGGGIDEPPSKDLETLKNILEALQLKGLLHSSSTVTTTKSHQNFVFDRRFSRQEESESESPIVLMKPAPAKPPVNRRRLNMSSSEPSVRERPARSALRSPARGENRSSIPVVRRKGAPLSIETQRRGNETTTTTTRTTSNSPVQSPRRSDQTANRSPRNGRSTVKICQGNRVYRGPPPLTEDEASTISESSFSTSSHTDNERCSRVEEYREGMSLLERCDKLLHSIAEMTASSNSVELQQPSPVSVLDSSFYKEDESSPSPVKKRAIDFKDQVVMELEDDLWSVSSSSQLLKPDHDIDSSDGSDFSYISEVLRASNYLPDDTSLFLLLEKQISIRGKDKSKNSVLQRKLIFDTITEIIDRSQQLPPWNSSSGRPTLEKIWSEFQTIQERGSSEDLFEIICGVLKKDLAGDSINGWGDCPIEVSEAVLDIERMIFKDLIGDTIQDLTAFAWKSPRRKLSF